MLECKRCEYVRVYHRQVNLHCKLQCTSTTNTRVVLYCSANHHSLYSTGQHGTPSQYDVAICRSLVRAPACACALALRRVRVRVRR